MLRSFSSRIASVVVLCTAASVAGCDGESDVGSTEDYATDGIQENTREARAVLAVANQLDATLLAEEVGLSPRVVENVIAYRTGDDEVVPSADDERFDTLAELDAVPMIGNAQFRALLRWGRDNGFLDDPTTPQGSGAAIWAVDLGAKSFGESEVLGVAADRDGNVVIGGETKVAVQAGLGVEPVPPIGKRDAFVAKLGRDGAPVWTRMFGTAAGNEAIRVVGVDARGEILVTSRTGDLDVGCGVTAGQGELLAKLDANGACLWSQRISLQADAAIALADDGRVALLTFLGRSFEGTEPLPQGWRGVVLLDAAGVPLAQRKLAQVAAPSLAFGPEGELALALLGSANDYGGGAMPAAASSTLDVAVLGPALEHRFSRSFVAQPNESGGGSWSSGTWQPGRVAPSVGVDAEGAVYVSAVFQGKVNLGGSTLTSWHGETGTVVSKLTAEGAHLWSASPLRSAEFRSPTVSELRTGADGSVYVTGAAASFEPRQLIKLDAVGRTVWSKRPGERFVYQTDGDGRILVAGTAAYTPVLGIPRGGGFVGVLTP